MRLLDSVLYSTNPTSDVKNNLDFASLAPRHHLARLGVNGKRSTTNVDYRVWLEQRRHANNISRVLSLYQQLLQILGIVGRLSCHSIIHSDAPPTVVGCSTFTELYRRHAPGVKQQLLIPTVAQKLATTINPMSAAEGAEFGIKFRAF